MMNFGGSESKTVWDRATHASRRRANYRRLAQSSETMTTPTQRDLSVLLILPPNLYFSMPLYRIFCDGRYGTNRPLGVKDFRQFLQGLLTRWGNPEVIFRKLVVHQRAEVENPPPPGSPRPR